MGKDKAWKKRHLLGGLVLNLYTPLWYHEDGYIIGDVEGLTRLRDSITKALETEKDTVFTEFDSGGEGYEVRVMPKSEEAFIGLLPPYKSAYEGAGNEAWNSL